MVFSRLYGMETIGLRYFNIYGRRQDPLGAYAAVIPQWIGALLRGKQPVINGDGSTSRDFCYVDNAVQANLLAALTEEAGALNTVYNIACNRQTSLNDLFRILRGRLAEAAGRDWSNRARLRPLPARGCAALSGRHHQGPKAPGL